MSISQEHKDKAIAAVVGGATITDASRRFHVAESTLRHWLKKEGFDFRQRREREWHDKAREMIARGFPTAEIANACGVYRSSIVRFCKTQKLDTTAMERANREAKSIGGAYGRRKAHMHRLPQDLQNKKTIQHREARVLSWREIVGNERAGAIDASDIAKAEDKRAVINGSNFRDAFKPGHVRSL